MISCATALQLLESPLPRLFPWLKIGLANILTLYAIVRINKTTGIAVAALRTCLAALFLTNTNVYQNKCTTKPIAVMWLRESYGAKKQIAVFRKIRDT